MVGVRYNVGDILELDVGKVMINGIPLTQQDTFALAIVLKWNLQRAS